jgi:tetratricopeptide (TPR) repeat protein
MPSQDAEAAQKIDEALRAAGIEVFLDQSELRGGDAWDQKIRHQIHHCALFMPVVSQHTQERLEGYFRLEWKLAVDRSHLMATERPFLVPVVVDGTRDQEAFVPDAFRAGEPMAIDDLAASLAKGGINESQERIDVADALLYSNSGDPANRQALAILGDLVQVNGAPVEAVELWASAASRAGVSTSQIVAALEPLLVRVPHDTAVLQSLAHAYEVMGDKAKSRDAYNQIILVSPSPEERHWAQQQADSARLQVSPPQASR